MCVLTPLHATACNNICAHIKGPVVHVRFWWIVETLKHPACTVGGSATLSQLASPEESNLINLWEKSQWDNAVVKRWNVYEKVISFFSFFLFFFCLKRNVWGLMAFGIIPEFRTPNNYWLKVTANSHKWNVSQTLSGEKSLVKWVIFNFTNDRDGVKGVECL